MIGLNLVPAVKRVALYDPTCGRLLARARVRTSARTIVPRECRKGIWSIFQNLVAEPFGTLCPSRQRDTTRRRPPELWEELSFLHKPPRPWNPLAGRMGFGIEAKSATVLVASTSARGNLENPREITAASHQLVPISAAGLQGEQPLVDRIM